MSRERRRRLVAWICSAALALLAVVAPLHGLAHAVQALQGASHQDPAAAHAHACEQCLQFAALDAAAPLASRVEATQPGTAPAPAAPRKQAPRSFAFTAYASRAPPLLG